MNTNRLETTYVINAEPVLAGLPTRQRILVSQTIEQGQRVQTLANTALENIEQQKKTIKGLEDELLISMQTLQALKNAKSETIKVNKAKETQQTEYMEALYEENQDLKKRIQKDTQEISYLKKIQIEFNHIKTQALPIHPVGMYHNLTDKVCAIKRENSCSIC